jgi:phosphate uptake regulator
VRQLLLSFRERDLVEEIGIESPTSAVGQRLIAKALEEIGDLIEEIAKTALELSSTGRGITKPLLTEIQSVGTSVQTIFGKTMKAVFSKDIKLANDNLSSLKAFGHQIRNVESNLEKGKDPDFSLIMSVLVNLEKVLGYCRIIAETTINMTLTESSDICTIERSNASF